MSKVLKSQAFQSTQTYPGMGKFGISEEVGTDPQVQVYVPNDLSVSHIGSSPQALNRVGTRGPQKQISGTAKINLNKLTYDSEGFLWLKLRAQTLSPVIYNLKMPNIFYDFFFFFFFKFPNFRNQILENLCKPITFHNP